MPFIYHIVARSTWEQRNGEPYRAASLASEGFIHCSYLEQVERIANRFYGHEPDLLVLCIDPQRLKSPVRDEDPGEGEAFPHVYGAIDERAVVAVLTLRRDAAGQWVFPNNS